MNKKLQEAKERLKQAEAELRQKQRRLERLCQREQVERSHPQMRRTVGNSDLAKAEREVGKQQLLVGTIELSITVMEQIGE